MDETAGIDIFLQALIRVTALAAGYAAAHQ
jgi:hypothetical protein